MHQSRVHSFKKRKIKSNLEEQEQHIVAEDISLIKEQNLVNEELKKKFDQEAIKEFVKRYGSKVTEAGSKNNPPIRILNESHTFSKHFVEEHFSFYHFSFEPESMLYQYSFVFIKYNKSNFSSNLIKCNDFAQKQLNLMIFIFIFRITPFLVVISFPKSWSTNAMIAQTFTMPNISLLLITEINTKVKKRQLLI